MSTISEKLSRLDASMSNIRASLNIDTSVSVEEVEAQVVNNNERVAILEEENYIITHPTCTMEIYAWEGMPLEGHLIRVKLVKVDTQEIIYESPLEGEETNFFTFNDLELGKYYECTVLSCKALDGSKGNYAVHPWNFSQFIAFNDNTQSIWLDPISSQGYYLNMSCMDDTTGELIDNLSLVDGYIEIYNENDGEGWMERSFSTPFPAREYFTEGNFSVKLCNLYRFDGRMVEFSDEKQYFTVTDQDVDVLFHFKTLGFPSHPVMLNFINSNGETIPSNCTIDFTVTKSDGTVEWHSVAGGNMAQVSMEIGTRNLSVKNIWNTDLGESYNELYVLPHDEFIEVYDEMEWTVVIALQDTAGGEPESPEETETASVVLHFMDETTTQPIDDGYITSARLWKDGEVAYEYWDSGSSIMNLDNIVKGYYEVEIMGVVPMPDTGLPEVSVSGLSRTGITIDGETLDYYIYINMGSVPTRAFSVSGHDAMYNIANPNEGDTCDVYGGTDATVEDNQLKAGSYYVNLNPAPVSENATGLELYSADGTSWIQISVTDGGYEVLINGSYGQMTGSFDKDLNVINASYNYTNIDTMDVSNISEDNLTLLNLLFLGNGSMGSYKYTHGKWHYTYAIPSGEFLDTTYNITTVGMLSTIRDASEGDTCAVHSAFEPFTGAADEELTGYITCRSVPGSEQPDNISPSQTATYTSEDGTIVLNLMASGSQFSMNYNDPGNNSYEHLNGEYIGSASHTTYYEDYMDYWDVTECPGIDLPVTLYASESNSPIAAQFMTRKWNNPVIYVYTDGEWIKQ